MKLRLLAATAAIALTIGLAASAIAGTPSNPNLLRAPLTGAAEVPGPGDPNGEGRALIGLRARVQRVCFFIEFRRIGMPLAGHIHAGRRGVAGDIVVPLFENANGVGSPVRGCARDVSRATIRAIRMHPRAFYVNLHTEAFPDGAIRGQFHPRRVRSSVTAPPRPPRGDLSGAGGSGEPRPR
jgi:hypothetical protein